MTEKDAFNRACSMEDPLVGIEAFAGALGRVAQTLADDRDGVIVLHLATAIRERVRKLEETHGFFSVSITPIANASSATAGRMTSRPRKQ